MAQGSFDQHCGDTHFKECDENALCLPEHAPETFEFLLRWMYQKQLGVSTYCQILFTTHGKAKEGVEAAFLLLCRIYILADYMDITEIMDDVMDELGTVLRRNMEVEFSPIGPDAVKTVFRNTPDGSELQELIIGNLAESFVHKENGRSIEAYTQCFSEFEGFGAAIMRRVLEPPEGSARMAGW